MINFYKLATFRLLPNDVVYRAIPPPPPLEVYTDRALADYTDRSEDNYTDR